MSISIARGSSVIGVAGLASGGIGREKPRADFVLVVILIVGFGEFEDGKRQRLAKQIAFNAHPHTRDVAVLDLHHSEGVAAGLENDDVAWV